jgi:2-polyprenyl-6-methoxyphenol hydroxylase-like FAD-dependent oxidoreductase
VLIIGAGPTGLTSAQELSRMGIEVRIVDDRPARSDIPQAVVVGSRTLQLLERRRLGQNMFRGANQVTQAGVYVDGGMLGKVPCTRSQSQPAYSLLVGQTETERVLREPLARQGRSVEQAAVIAVAQPPGTSPGEDGDRNVRCILRHRDGRLEEVTAPYLISADGTFTTVRQTVEQPSHAKPPGRGYILADLELDGDVPGDELSIFLGRRGFLAFFPLRPRWFRCLVTDPQAPGGNCGDPAIEELQQVIGACSTIPVRLRHMSWSGRLSGGLRDSPVLRHDRIFFGGGSAQAYRPASGQRLDSGIQDMINLSWKLAMVVRGQAVPGLLETYTEERLPVIRRVQKTADSAANLLGTSNAIARLLVTRVAPAFLDSRFVLRLCADLAGETIADYRESSLSAPARGPGGLQPGDYVPSISVLARDADAPPGVLQCPKRLDALLDPSRLTLLFTDPSPAATPDPAWQDQLAPWRGTMQAYRIAPISGPQGESLRYTETFGGRQSVLVVRPDSYVGFAGRQHAISDLARWLSRWFPAERGRSTRTRWS